MLMAELKRPEYAVLDNATYHAVRVSSTDPVYFKNADASPVTGQKIIVNHAKGSKTGFVGAAHVIEEGDDALDDTRTDFAWNVVFGDEAVAWSGKLRFSKFRWVISDVDSINESDFVTARDTSAGAIEALFNKPLPDFEELISDAESCLQCNDTEEMIRSLCSINETLLVTTDFVEQQAQLMCLRVKIAYTLTAYRYCALQAQYLQSTFGNPALFIQEFEPNLHRLYFSALIAGALSWDRFDLERCNQDLEALRVSIPQVFEGDDEAVQELLAETESSEHKSDTRSIFTIRIRLGLESAAEVFRTLEVCGMTTLEELREHIVASFGWVGAEADEFVLYDHGRIRIGPTPEAEDNVVPVAQDAQSEICLKDVDGNFAWVYDTEDDKWEHSIEITDRQEVDIEEIESGQYPRCVDGAGATPPESIGGVKGYRDFLHTTLTDKPSARFPSKLAALEHACHNIGAANSALTRCHGVFKRPKKLVTPPHNMAILCADHEICGEWKEAAFELDSVNRALEELVIIGIEE